ncbi:MAG: hypothetical protein ACRCZ0_10800 [Cetobacterium sp.]
MASPSNKKDGSTYLDKFTKEQIIKRHLDLEAELMRLEEKYNKLTTDNNALNKQFETIKKRYDRVNTTEEIFKKILQYKAMNLVPTTIKEKLELQGIDVDLKKIKDIYNGELSLDMETYYKQCVANHIENIRINTTYYKQSSIEEINRLLAYAYETLEACDLEDVKMRMSIMDSISNYIAKRDNLMKNIDETGNMTEEDEALNETTENFKDSARSVLKLVGGTNIKVIGG